jgi:23S rRNA (adenine2503-C2)-methyltransferase
MNSFFDLTLPQLTDLLVSWNEPRYRAKQIWQAAYRDLVQTPEAMTTLPHTLREKLKAEFTFGSLTPAAEAKSSDHQTRKILFRLPDGKQIETVLMDYEHRHTTCISTQAGCAMGCVFCATGQMGFRRHLSAGEIVEQVLWFERELRRPLRPSTSPRLKARGSAQGAEFLEGHLTNIVIMGMGEPFHNYEATLAAIDILNHPEGFNFGARRITLSTVGLPPMIERFAAEKRQVNLAVSLHAATDSLRTELLPINKKYPLAVLFAAIRNYFETTRRRVTFEWALIQGKNDTPEQARALAELAHGLPCHVNVIPLNPTRNYAGAASTRERAAAFKAMLEAHGIPCTIRVRRGIDINAGCGQLAGEKELTSV